MNLINPSVDYIEFDKPGKKMEYCGRVCYNSLDKITEDSHVKFLTSIYKSGHTSVLEHERVIFNADISLSNMKNINEYYSISGESENCYISANVRTWLNSTDEESVFYPYLKELYPYLFTEEPMCGKSSKIKVISEKELPKEEVKYHVPRTFKIVCSRGCSHQLVRHRIFSFSQQSQRYCAFNGPKFNHSVDFIIPIIDDVKEFSDEEKRAAEMKLATCFKNAEGDYFELIEKYGLRAEDARNVLPNAAATILMMTGTGEQWEKFFELRCDKHAQREIRDIANKIKEIINEKTI